MTRITTARMRSAGHTIGTHILRCILYILDTGLVITDFRYRGSASITVIIMAGITTGTEAITGTAVITDTGPAIMADPVITIDRAITADPAIIARGHLIGAAGTTGAGVDEKKAKGMFKLRIGVKADQHALAGAASARQIIVSPRPCFRFYSLEHVVAPI